MPPLSDRSPSSGRRIISRITSPFTSKTRNIADFSIEPDDPHKQYSPGDIVYKTPGSPGEGYRAHGGYLGAARSKKPSEYYGNGFASLFEDEVALCGDGRLAEGSYQFDFELEFPDRDLPSSIDFERGTISYLITATMTRPTAISPVISCDRKVYFVERIDISPLLPPKSRTITLEPIAKRSRAKHQARKLVDSSDKKRNTDSILLGSEQPRQSETSSRPDRRTGSETPVSDAPSEISLESGMSSQGRLSPPDSHRRDSPSIDDAGKYISGKVSIANKVITATIESQAGGCLRGDTIPVKVDIMHTKHIKSLYGVIITLYRQARVDMRPAMPSESGEKSKQSRAEEYYPKSMTGFGGLSLTGAGSNHVFRKDLSQTTMPLMIDPQTLTAEINAKVRVPDDAFPTISTVPGAMISFRIGTWATIGGTPPLPENHLREDDPDMERSALAPYGSAIVDTAPIRRYKGVVMCTFEVIVGTRDSERKKGKRKIMEPAAEPEPLQDQAQSESPDHTQGAHSTEGWYDGEGYTEQQWHEAQHPYAYAQTESDSRYMDQIYERSLPPVPIPPTPDESQMTEKERIQQAETRLLPSQPPGAATDQEDTAADATAPYLPEEAHDDSAPNLRPVGHEHGINVPNSLAHVGEGASRGISNAPEYAPPHGGSSVLVVPEDKQDLQHQLLQAEASAPPIDDDDESAGPSSVAQDHAPLAPTLNEADSPPRDLHDSHADAAVFSDLPRYER